MTQPHTKMLYCVGNSHIAAVRAAAEQSGAAVTFVHATEAYILNDEGALALKPDVVAMLQETTGPIFSMVGGNAHNNFGIIQQGPAMDFIHPRHPHLSNNSTAMRLPYQLVRDAVEQRASVWPAVFTALCQLAPGRIIHFESPPPIANEQFLVKRLRGRFRARGLDNIKINPPTLRYKLWQTNSDIYRDLCARHGQVFVPSPEVAQTSMGFLAYSYWNDPTHANQAYGALVLQRMEEFASAPSV